MESLDQKFFFKVNIKNDTTALTVTLKNGLRAQTTPLQFYCFLRYHRFKPSVACPEIKVNWPLTATTILTAVITLDIKKIHNYLLGIQLL